MQLREEGAACEAVEDAEAALPLFSREPGRNKARIATTPTRTAARWKITKKLSLSVLGVSLALSVWFVWKRGEANSVEGGVQSSEMEFQVKTFPDDCKNFMRFQGCEKHRWLCDKDSDQSMGYKCCCETSYWDDVAKSQGHSSMPHPGGPVVLRLKRTMDVCLGGPQDGGSHFSLIPCDQPSARMNVSQSGTGPLELEQQPGFCLSVAKGTNQVKVAECVKDSPQQTFELTERTWGMLQWSKSEGSCLDTSNDGTDFGVKVELADCVYWPKKKSQLYVLEDAPALKEEHHTKKVLQHPSLFCVAVMLPWTYEVDMLRSQLAKNIGMFQCDGWAVVSNEKVKLKDGRTEEEDIYCDVMNGTLKAKIGGKFHTALNTPVFQRFWQHLIDDGRVWHYDWIVKVDPDTVFFPDRLKEMLSNEYKPRRDSEESGGTPHKAVWLNNCQLGLHGPIEVFSKQALGAYKDADGACDDVAKKYGQEDVYLRHCFTKIKVPKVDALNLLLESDWACNERPSSSTNMPPCYDRQVSFHPFKTVESWLQCYKRASKMHWSTPQYFNSVPPSAKNAHHA